MTYRNHPTDLMGNPDGRDYHYRFRANNREAQKALRHARWKDRYIEMYPKDMKHLRVKIDHVTVKTYDKMGYIKGMKKYAVSPDWQRVPYSRGKAEMKHANGGGSKIRAEEYTGEKWGTVTVDFYVDATPGEITDAFENGVNEAAITREVEKAKMHAVDARIDELREELLEYQEDCEHDHVVKDDGIRCIAYCEDCSMEWRDEDELEATIEAGEATVVGVTP